MKIPLPLNLIQVFNRKDHNALAQRALALWGLTYPMAHEQQLFREAELLSLLAHHTPAYGRRIIRAAVELKLLSKGRWYNGAIVYHRTGSAAVMHLHLNGDKPGKLIYIEASDLASKSLQRLRSVLHHTFAAAKPRIRSRAVQAKLTGFTEQTTRNWTKVLKDEGSLFVKPNHYEFKAIAEQAGMPISAALRVLIGLARDGVVQIKADDAKLYSQETSRRGDNRR